MQDEATMQERLIHAYVSSQTTRLLCVLTVPGAAVLLYFLSGGFPPWAWKLLLQTLPQITALLALRGQAALLALAGLALLSLTILLAWLLLLWLAWRMLAYALYEQRELRLFAVEMQEAQYLAQQEVHSTQRSASSEQLEDEQYPWSYPSTDPLEGEQYGRSNGFSDSLIEEPYSRSSLSVDQLENERYARGYPSTDPLEDEQYSQSYAFAGRFMGIEDGYQQGEVDEVERGAGWSYGDAVLANRPGSHSLHLSGTAYAWRDPACVASHVPTHPLSSAPRRRTTVDLASPGAWEYASTMPLSAATLEPLVAHPETQLVVSTALDVGLRRKDKPNEDSLLAMQHTRILHGAACPAGLFVVADGMGGHENGQEASRLVVRALSEAVVPSLYAGPVDDNYMELLSEGVHRANLALYQCNRRERADMGTTLAAALIVNTTAYIANVGDSRVYLYRAASGLSQVTRDHSTVARLVEAGMIQPDEVYTHPRRNEIYRSLGHQASQDVDTFILALQPGDLLLLCSDGLWEMVRDLQIQEILASDPQQPEQLSTALVRAALDGGGKDNISVIVVCVQRM